MKVFLSKLDSFFLLDKERLFPELDGLRAWAIIMVMMAHVGSWLDNLASESVVQTDASKVIEVFFYNFPFIGTAGGGAGVDLFFMLSGFLIFMTTYKKRTTVFEFLKKRYQRLLPVHMVLLLSFMVPLSLAGVVLNMLFLSEFFIHYPTVHLITWTLSYEFVFYVIAAYWFIYFRNVKVLQTWSAFFLFFVFIFLSQWFVATPLDKIGIKYLDTSRFIAFFFGVALARLYFCEKKIWKKYQKYFEVLFVPGLLLVSVFRYSYQSVSVNLSYGYLVKSLSYLFLDFGFLLIFLSLLTQKDTVLKSIFRIKFVRIIGAISYSMYLFHYSFALPMSKNILGFIHNIPLKMLVFIPTSFLVTIFFSVVLFHFLEKPYFLQSDMKRNQKRLS